MCIERVVFLRKVWYIFEFFSRKANKCNSVYISADVFYFTFEVCLCEIGFISVAQIWTIITFTLWYFDFFLNLLNGLFLEFWGGIFIIHWIFCKQYFRYIAYLCKIIFVYFATFHFRWKRSIFRQKSSFSNLLTITVPLGFMHADWVDILCGFTFGGKLLLSIF